MPDEETPAPETPPETPVPVAETPPPADPPVDELGDAGKRALAAERKEKTEAIRHAKKLEAELEEFRKGQMSEQEKAVAEALKRGEKVSDDKHLARVLAAEVKAAAGGILTDPADAVKFIDLTQFTADEDGTFDAEAISAAIATLVTSKPYLAPSKGPGSGDGGPRGTGATPGQLTRADLDRMSPDEIVKAKAEGRFNDILSIGASKS